MRNPFRIFLLCAGLWLCPSPARGETTNQVSTPEALSARTEQVRATCVANRRKICGRVLDVTPAGLVIESGYTNLFAPRFNHDWLTPANADVPPRPNLIEATVTDSLAVGVVFLTDYPRRPKVHQYDYVTLIGYPAGQYIYQPMPGIQKPVRRFAGGLERAVTLTMQPGEH